MKTSPADTAFTQAARTAAEAQHIISVLAAPPEGASELDRLLHLLFTAKRLGFDGPLRPRPGQLSELHLNALDVVVENARGQIKALFVPATEILAEPEALMAHWECVYRLGHRTRARLALPPIPSLVAGRQPDAQRDNPLAVLMAEWCSEASRLTRAVRMAVETGCTMSLCDELAKKWRFLLPEAAQEIREANARTAPSPIVAAMMRSLGPDARPSNEEEPELAATLS